MFRRRHPYLFFVLMFFAIGSLASLGMTLLVYLGWSQADPESALRSGGDKVAVIEVEGVITDATETLHWLKTFREAKTVRGIVVRIDSPGGVVGPSQEIYREIIKTRKVKKVIASMGAVAASGGYYIAAGADGIIANPGTITGSIGVIVGYTNFRSLLDKIGLVPVVVKSGEFKDIGSPTREMSAAERNVLQTFVDQTHRQFVTAISEGRAMDPDKVAELADGRIYTGEEAHNLGLVDRLGNFEDAVEWAGREGGIQGKIETVYPPPKKYSFLRNLATSSVQAVLDRLAGGEINGGYLYRP